MAEEVSAFARELFDSHPSADSLIEQAGRGARYKERRRASVALLALDPDNPLPLIETMGRVVSAWWAAESVKLEAAPPTPAVLENIAQAVGTVLVGLLRSAERNERRHLGGLLSTVCREAERIAKVAVA